MVPPLARTSIQTLQILCQKHGWGYLFGADEATGDWFLDIFYGLGEWKRFMVPIPKQALHGKTLVSEAALVGLREIIEREESKRILSFKDVFPNPIVIYDSHSKSTWERFWNDSPTEVGVDCEGNSISPPVLVQISTENYTILETPLDGHLSENLQRLLGMKSIVKIFCDNYSHRDKICLGLNVYGDYNERDQVSKKTHIVDIEILSNRVIGPSKTPRGLSKLVCLCFPELNVRISKSGKSMKQRFRNIGKFVEIEQGKAEPLKGICDLNDTQRQYAALDSWCTLKIYQRMVSIMKKEIAGQVN